MQTFNFYQDAKQTVWVRSTFSIDAETLEEAVEKAKTFRNEDVADSLDEGIAQGSSETLYDTSELLNVEENAGCATFEIYTEEGVLICQNGNNNNNCTQTLNDIQS